MLFPQHSNTCIEAVLGYRNGPPIFEPLPTRRLPEALSGEKLKAINGEMCFIFNGAG
jgi:hypothetical protein